MDEESGATVYLNVLLNNGLFGVVIIASEFSVHKSETVSHSPENPEFENGPVNVEEHSSDQSVTDV